MSGGRAEGFTMKSLKNTLFFLGVLSTYCSNSFAFRVDSSIVKVWNESNSQSFVINHVEKCQKYKSTYFTPEAQDLKKLQLRVMNSEELNHYVMPLFSDQTISFNYLITGCEARSHLMALELDKKNISNAKIFISDENLRVLDRNTVITWGYHVASLILIEEDNGKSSLRVIDPGLVPEPVSIEQWSCKMTGHSESPSFVLNLGNRFHYWVGDRNDELNAYDSHNIKEAMRVNEENLQKSP